MTVQHYPRLAAYTPVEGVITLCEVDSVDIALANVLVGVSHAQPQDGISIIVDNTPQNIIAVPYIDIEITDETARQFILIEDLLKKMERWPGIDGDIGLAITGDVSKKLIKLVQQNCALKFVTVIAEPTIELTLAALENNLSSQQPDSWLWISVHAGCAQTKIKQQGKNIATNVSSEHPMPADAAVAIRLSKERNKSVSATIKSVYEPNTNDPLLQPTHALETLLSEQADVENSVLIHSMPNTAQGNIELYRLEQFLNEKRTEELEDIPWQSLKPSWYNLSSILGDIGVCQLPLMLLLQTAWQQEQPLITIATEDSTRFIWQL